MAAAKHAATATNPGDIWDALSADCTMPERRKEGATPAAARDLAMRPLWPVPDWREKRDIFHRGRWQSGIPAWARDGEAALFAALERHPGEHWDVWARWYRDRVRGKPLTRSDREFLEAMVLLDRENGFAAWQHPAEINARIRELEARGPEPRRPRLPADRQSPVNFVFRGAVIDRAPPPPPAVPDTRRAELESARRALAGLFDDTLGGPISNREPRLGTVLQRCREALGRDLGTLEPVALGIVADRLNGYAARADALLLPELAAEVVSLNAQTALFLAQFAEWRDYARAMETALGAEAAELAAVAEATEAVGAIIGAEPALLTEPAAGALALLGEEAAADPAPLVRRSYLRAVRAFALTLAARAVEAVGAGAEIGVRNTAAAAVMAGAAYLGTLATGLPAEFGWLNAVIAWVGRWLR
ncbi:hypothetical protein [Paralimibaculum aggregatum]|nr:hypothetical protein [Limibaculum sp. NKW23]